MKRNESVFLILVAVFAVVLVWISLTQFHKTWGIHSGAGEGAGAMGKARDADMRKVRTMIQERALSGHEAQFYKKSSEGRTDKPEQEQPSEPIE
jgi:hypothetical protein